MTLAEKVSDLEVRLLELRRTPCARCGHFFGVHWRSEPRCDGRWSDEKQCRCKAFQDPGERLL